MAIRVRLATATATALALVLGAWIAATPPTARAQGILVQSPDLFQSGMQTPRFPPAGDWAEIVTVTSKWLVIQNQRGQQFPVALDSIAQFVIRWPIDPSAISPTALVETTGIDLGSNQIRTDHVDVFEGPARTLVGGRQLIQQVIGYNRTPTMFDIQNKNNYGVFIPLMPGEDQIPNRLHIIGPVIAGNPMRVDVGGNIAVAVYPAANGLLFSQVTPGTTSFLRPKDLVYVVPTDITPKSLILGQMVGYKNVPLNRFVP